MPADTAIENPILNGPFEEPKRHFKFTDEGISNEIVGERRTSSYFVPIAKSKKASKQLTIEFDEMKQDRIEENKLVNQIRERIGRWRSGGYVGVTPTSKKLLMYWTEKSRDNRLFFCQIEALEAAIYITEVAKKYGDQWIENILREANDSSNPGLPRLAFKMATGTGKTVVMAMLIAWQSLNKLARPQDTRFSDAFVIIAPGITIRDRLRVLLPNDPENYYRKRDIVPSDLMESLRQSKIVIVNFHAFLPREINDASKLAKSILLQGSAESAFLETGDQLVRRVCREFGNKRNVIVINDEAHHCYRRRPDAPEDLRGEEKKEAEENNEEARIWISGIEAIKKKIGIRAIYDLSATPFFLNGSGWPEGTLFPWVVSDFSLIDAIESGVVKVPRVPIADNTMRGEQPTYRDLWIRIRDDLPKRSRRKEEFIGEPKLPAELQGAIHSLYDNYKIAFDRFLKDEEAATSGRTPPVFIVVCNNTNVSKLVYDYISGWEKPLPGGGSVPIPGELPIFSNVADGKWVGKPNTILVDSQQLESGEAMSPDFKGMAAREIEEFKADYKLRFPGREIENITDEEILREVMNTVGKAGKLGESVKCVVSVSMLTEGWDANTVTHILGVRAFSTQLLCEQVVGRGLRRMSYAVNELDRFEPEYAEVYGVPFSFIPCTGGSKDPKPGPVPTRVRALKDRLPCEISFPRVVGYRYEFGTERLSARFSEESKLYLSTESVPTRTENAPIVGETSEHTLDDLKDKRENEVAFRIAKLVLETYFRDDSGWDRPWLFPQLLQMTKDWLANYVICKDNTFKQMLLLHELANDASRLIWNAIVAAPHAQAILKPILRPYDSFGTTQIVDFDTTRPVFVTRADKCHISHVVADTDSWEQKMAESLESMKEVRAYAKNHNLGFAIPYTLNGEERNYLPDFLVRYDDDSSDGEELNLILEVTGERRKDKAAKVSAAKTLWVQAVNNHSGLGRWSFLEVYDPWDAQNLIRAHVKELAGAVSV